jgi:hypothetical protein
MALQIGQARHQVTAGATLVGLGTLLLAAMMAFPERLNVPAPIGYLTAGTFVLAGLLALGNVFCSRGVRAWLAVVLLSCMVLPSIWIAIGPGQRSCSVDFGILFGFAGGGVCRAAFGVASVFGVIMVLVALRYALSRGRDEA